MAIKAIITGSTGMVGEGVLLECLANPDVEQVLVVNRKPGGVSHPKLREVLLSDFFNPASIKAELAGYNACFFCLGVSSVGMDKDVYKRMTYDLTVGFAQVLARINPELAFCYVTGAGTDSSEQGPLAWARVKGATENALIALFKRAYMFRPGMMKASEGQKNLKWLYKSLAWLYPVLKALYPSRVCTLHEVGLAMIHVADKGFSKNRLEVPDIIEAARASTAQR
jgi:hypothetical protein